MTVKFEGQDRRQAKLDKVMAEYHLKYERLLMNFSDEELKYLKHNSLKLFCNLDFF